MGSTLGRDGAGAAAGGLERTWRCGGRSTPACARSGAGGGRSPSSKRRFASISKEEIEERIAEGTSPEQARAAARRDFGNVTLIREQTRETWGWGPAERLLQDVRSAIWALRRNRGYTCAVVLTLALGIGLNAAMYGLLSQLFLQAPPHIEDPDGIHRVWLRERDGRSDLGAFTGAVIASDRMDWAEFSALRADPDRFTAVGGYTAPERRLNGRGQTAEELQVSWVTGDFFALLGVHPALGRLIGPEDDDLAAAPAAVISDGYWRRRFGRAREALGATVSFDDVTYVIVGVLPPGFSGPDPSAADVWLPLQIAATGGRGDGWKHSGSGFYLTALVRLAPGVTAAAAATAATGGVRAASADLTWKDPEPTVVLGPILMARGPADLRGDMQLPLVVGGVALAVLLIATANASNLLMLRVAARRRELAVRHALGAGRWGVGRLLVIESVLLAALSGVAALGVAAVAGRVLRVTLLPRYQWAGDPLEPTTIAFTAGAVLAVGLAAALFPAVYAARSRGIERLDGLPEFLHRQRTLIVRTRGNPERTVPPVLAAMAELFPDLPANRVQSLPALFAARIRTWSVGTGLFAAAALLAVLLAALGLYAVIAFGVRQRELEFGIRRALGALPSDLLRMVLARGFTVTAVGVAAGAGAALGAGRFVGPLLFDGHSPRDPLALAVAALVLVTAALAASLLPARRAGRADPRQALQAE